MTSDKFNLQGVIDRLEQTKRDLPLVLANQAERFFQDSFKKEGWDNNGISKWQPRKNNKTSRDKTRNILVKSGRLRRSIQVQQANFDSIIIGSDVPYAAVHNNGNEGIVHKVGFYSRGNRLKIGGKKVKSRINKYHDVSEHFRRGGTPQRQFIGDSSTLQKQQIKVITKVLDEIWR